MDVTWAQALRAYEAERASHDAGASAALEYALSRLADALAPSAGATAARGRVVAAIHAAVAQALGGLGAMGIEPYGSYVSGFFLPSSDLDLALAGRYDASALPRDVYAALAAELGHAPSGASVPLALLDRESHVELLKGVARALERGRLARGYIQRVFRARVPIMTFFEATTGVACDVSVATPGTSFKAKARTARARARPGALSPLCAAPRRPRPLSAADVPNSTPFPLNNPSANPTLETPHAHSS
jgi:predicted nucleotidyltransferase